jgi:hypothetical protein
MVPGLLCELLFCGVLTLFGCPAEAGLYHTRAGGVCQDCHKTPPLDEQARLLSPRPPAPRTGSPVPLEVNRTCLDCHSGYGDTRGASPVLSRDGGDVVRQAGYLNGSEGLAHTGHTLGSTQRAPGGTWTPGPKGLACTDCHDPHGQTTQYRNLVLRPGTVAEDRPLTFVLGLTNDLTKDVWIRAALGGAGKYDARNVRFNQPRAGRSAYGEWCQGCHTEFHGGARDFHMRGPGAWKRHPTADASIGGRVPAHTSWARHASLANRVPTLSASGAWPAPDNTPSCISCHKAHGNGNPFGLLYMAGQGQLTECGDSQGKTPVDLCRQCHAQGLTSRS